MSAGQAKNGVSPAAVMLAFYRTLSPERRRRLFLVMAATAAGTLAELAAIGAVLPFITLLADPGRAAQLPGWDLFAALVGGGSPAALARKATFLLIAAALTAAAARLVILRLTLDFGQMAAHDISLGIFSRSLHQPYSRHVERNSAELLGSVEKLHITVTGVIMPLVQVPVAVVMATAIAVLLLAINPLAGAAGLVSFGLFYFLVSKALHGRLRRSSTELAQAATQRMKTLQEAMGSIRDVILEQTQSLFEEEYRQLDLRLRRAQRLGAFVGAAPRFLAEALGIVLLGLLALYMSTGAGGVTPALPLLGVLALGAQRLMPLLQQIYYGGTSVRSSLPVLQDMLGLLEKPVVELPAERPAPLPFERQIEVDDVSFRFGTERGWALRNIRLALAAGSRIAIVGHTGSGKSTFFDLLMGLLDPTEGEIRVDGTALDPVSRLAWQRQISHVPQAIYLTDRSIAANIAFGAADDEIDAERVREAARRAQIHRFVETLPQGYDTPVGERGVRLSGGERQRIAIARALYRGARLLILDEATAALDEATEAAVMEAICAADPGLTILIATHRQSAIAWCDRIITVEGGRIIDDRAARQGVAAGAARG